MNAEAEGRAAAERFRSAHHLGVQALGDLVTIIEQTTGVDVAVLDVGPDEHGLTMRDPRRGTVLIGVARTRNPMRQRSTLAHELAHVVFEDWQHTGSQRDNDNWSDRTPEEIRADAFARHLLVPVEGVRTFLGDHREATLALLSSVVQWFLVSPQMAAIALHQAEYVDTATKQNWMALSTPQIATRFGWSDQYELLRDESNQRRAPQRLLARAIAGYREGVLSAQAIATLRGVTLEQTESELRSAGITPAERQVMWAEATDLPAVDIDLADLDADLRDDPDRPDPAPSRDTPGHAG